jgi:multidrug efflux pump
VLMVATLVLSFGSFRVAALVGVVGMLSVGLGLGALSVFGHPFGFMAIIGSMGLAGVAINDAIVVLAALREDPEARRGDPIAVRNVVTHSTRHVVATSLTTMAGFAPLVIAGGGFWPPLAIAISGGVGGATILALYFIPSAYILAMSSGQHHKKPLSTIPERESPVTQTPQSQVSADSRIPAAVDSV